MLLGVQTNSGVPLNTFQVFFGKRVYILCLSLKIPLFLTLPDTGIYGKQVGFFLGPPEREKQALT